MVSFKSVFACSLLSLLFFSCKTAKNGRGANTMPGSWQATPINIDGDCKDWPSPYPNYDSKGRIAYATSNDAKYLYVSLQTGDELTQMKILKAGVVLGIDTAGRKNTELHINFPMANDNSELELPPPGKTSSFHFDRRALANIKKVTDQANQYTVDGFELCNGGFMVSQTMPCGIKIKAKIDEYNEMVWEAAIPIKAILGHDSLSTADVGRALTVCYTVKGITVPKAANNETMNTNQSASMANPSSGSMGRGGRGGMNTGGQRGRAAQSSANDFLSETTKTWKTFKWAGR